MERSVYKLGAAHHFAYVVEEIEAAVRRLNEGFGAGPFLHIADATPPEVDSRGGPAQFVHSTAFAICNGVAIELIQVGRIEPARAAERFRLSDDGKPRLHHVAYVLPAEEVGEVREGLEARGMPEYLRARIEDLELTFHDASESLGHDIEIHTDCESLRNLFGLVREEAEGWDGSDLLRPFG